MGTDHIDQFMEDSSYYFTLYDDTQLLQRVAALRGDRDIAAVLAAFMRRLRAIAAVTLAYWRHGQSGNRTDIAWAVGLGENERDLDSFLAEFGFTDTDLHQKSLQELVHRDHVTGTLARAIETSRENYTAFLQCLESTTHPLPLKGEGSGEG